MSTHVEVALTAPLPASGTMEFTDVGHVRVSFDIDLAGEVYRAILTKKAPDFAKLTQESIAAVVAALVAKVGAQKAVLDALVKETQH